VSLENIQPLLKKNKRNKKNDSKQNEMEDKKKENGNLN
jgi:hypothetical protein